MPVTPTIMERVYQRIEELPWLQRALWSIGRCCCWNCCARAREVEEWRGEEAAAAEAADDEEEDEGELGVVGGGGGGESFGVVEVKKRLEGRNGFSGEGGNNPPRNRKELRQEEHTLVRRMVEFIVDRSPRWV